MNAPMTRRQLMKQAASWAAFMALARRGDAQIITANPRVRGTARACIFFNLNGAASHVDTFDVKDGPWNPPDARIQQFPGGIALSTTLFPRLSQMTGDLCVLRSVRSWEAAHERGVFYMQTAHPSNPAFVAETPHIGAVVGLEQGGAGPMPPFLAPVVSGTTMQGATFLGGSLAPMAAPANTGGLSTIEHNYFGAQSQQRFEERYAMLQELDAALRSSAIDRSVTDHADYYQAAKRLMYDQQIASVFRFTDGDNIKYGNSALGRAT